MTVWFTSDTHIGGPFATRLRNMGSTQAHDARIAGWWDENVDPEDTVIILGDVTEYPKDHADRALEWLKARPGKKILITGNWDWKHLGERGLPRWLMVFNEIHDHRVEHALDASGDFLVNLHHYPYDHNQNPERRLEWAPRDAIGNRGILLHGHTHSREKLSSDAAGVLMIHVGWDAWRRFVSAEELIEIIGEIRSKSA